MAKAKNIEDEPEMKRLKALLSTGQVDSNRLADHLAEAPRSDVMPVEWIPTAFYTIDDVTKEACISRKTVERSIRAGDLKACKVARQYRIEGVALVKWFRRGDSAAAPEAPAKAKRKRSKAR